MSGNNQAASTPRRFIRRWSAAGAGAFFAVAVLAAPASAAEPNNQGCLGHDIRGYARAGAGFGAFVKSLADGGVGMEIQAHLAGQTPDASIPNTCNDN